MKKLPVFIVVLFILGMITGCKKALFNPDFGYIDANINGEYAFDKVSFPLYSNGMSFAYYYNYKDFYFTINRPLETKEGKTYFINIYIRKKSLPKLGERYPFVIYDDFQEETDSIHARVAVYPYWWECMDTTLLPKEIRKKRASIGTNPTNATGYIEFTKLGIEKKEISGNFCIKAEGEQELYPEIKLKVNIQNGHFEGLNMTRSDEPFYSYINLRW